MGMSHDYKIALEEGANMVRIGSAIFGERTSEYTIDLTLCHPDHPAVYFYGGFSTARIITPSVRT
jgi:hypothetical protein